MNAHPPRTRWHVETYDPLAREWSSGLPLTDRQTAVTKLDRLTTHYPRWADGTECERRIVLETTTFEDLTTDTSHLALFPKSGFVLSCPGGHDLGAIPDITPDGRPAIRLITGSSESGHAEATVALDQLEEVIAGLRDMARQADQQPTADPSCQCLPASPVEGPLTCDPHLPAQPAEALAVAERQFLSFALDLAFDRMASCGDEFTAEDHAALARFRRMTTEDPQQPARGNLVIHVEAAPNLPEMIRNIVHHDPGSAGMVR